MSTARRILVVEDEVLVRDFIVDVLEEQGWVVTGAVGTAQEAIASVASDRPDLALIDIRLPGAIDGIELAHRLVRQGIEPIFASGSNDAATRARVAALGDGRFLSKPFRAEQLVEAIEALCRRTE
jgi:CheY-like chemotaxis protein